MEWAEFNSRYGHYSTEFNNQSFEERVRVSKLMTYDSIRELIRSKKNLISAIEKIDIRIKELSTNLEEDLIKVEK